MPLFPRFGRILLICAAFVLGLGGAQARAAGESWDVGSIEGAALVLIDDQWHEIGPGDRVFDGQPIRTLQTGSIVLRHEGMIIELAPETAAELDVLGASRAVITQYAGTVSAIIPDRARLVFRAGGLTARANAGRVTVRMDGGGASVTVDAGAVRVSDRSGESVTLTANQTASEGPTGGVSGATTGKAPATPAIRANPNGPGMPATPATPAAPANSGSNGNGNNGNGIGGNGNIGSNGNGNNGNSGKSGGHGRGG